MLKDTRKLFSITTTYDPNFLFPGSWLPGPDAPRLTEAKTVGDITYPAGELDPEWTRPDTDNISFGEVNGRFYYSVRADMCGDVSDLGADLTNDPQYHDSVSQELMDQLSASPFISDVLHEEGGGRRDERFRALFPTADSLASAMQSNPEMVQTFLEQEAQTAAQIMAKLGVVVAQQ